MHAVFFLRCFEEPKRFLKIVQRSLKICKFSLERLLTAVSFTNFKTGGLSNLVKGSLSQTLKNTVCTINLRADSLSFPSMVSAYCRPIFT